jgi:hypothetical protein
MSTSTVTPVTPVVVVTAAATSDTEHGVKTATWRKNPLNAVPYLDCMAIIERKFDGFKLANVLPIFTDDKLEDLQAKIKKATRRQDKKANKFVPVDVKKSRSAIRIFQADDLEKCTADERKTYVKNGMLSKHWKALSDKERAAYEDKANTEKATYMAEYNRQIGAAIETGAWQEPKPKRPNSAYFHFMMSAEVEAACKKQGLKGINRSKLISEQWKALSADAKKVFEDLNSKDKARFEADMVKYNERAEARKAGQVVPAAEPVAANPKKAVAAAPAPAAAAPAAASAPKKEKSVKKETKA